MSAVIAGVVGYMGGVRAKVPPTEQGQLPPSKAAPPDEGVPVTQPAISLAKQAFDAIKGKGKL
jgi:hypothetical protein